MPVYHDTNRSADSIQSAIEHLSELLNTVPNRLRSVPEHIWCEKPSPDKWSKKEILGHLIDSATNNHHRFIRSQFEHHPSIRYAQVEWVRHSFYQEMPAMDIIDLWESYNRLILHIWRHLPDKILDRTCDVGDETPRTVRFIIHDYVGHMEHHLGQILSN